MQITINIPAALKVHTNKKTQVVLSIEQEHAGNSQCQLRVVLYTLIAKYSGLAEYVFNQDGELNNFINIYLNEKDARFLTGGLATPVKDGDEVSLLLATAGG